MMTLLGQHGQQQDYARGLQLIRQAAETADENAPQGAYVCDGVSLGLRMLTFISDTRLAAGS